MVGGTYNVECPVVEFYLLLVTNPLIDDVFCVIGFPSALAGTDETGMEGFPPCIEGMGGLATGLE